MARVMEDERYEDTMMMEVDDFGSGHEDNYYDDDEEGEEEKQLPDRVSRSLQILDERAGKKFLAPKIRAKKNDPNSTLEEQFHEAWSKYWGPIHRARGKDQEEMQLFSKALEDFYEITKARSKLLQGKPTQSAEDLWVEAQTWLLFLLRESLEADIHQSSMPPIEESWENNPNMTAYQVMLELIKDPWFARCTMVQQWLEMLKREEVEDDDWEETDMPRRGFWSSTADRIHQGDSTILQGQGPRYLDPDTPFRNLCRSSRSGGPPPQLVPLDTRDENNDRVLLDRVWRFLRRGMLQEAQEICTRGGQPWRAASISGCPTMAPWHVTDDEGQMGKVNTFRHVQWQVMTMRTARRLADLRSRGPNSGDPSSILSLESAIYAALSSDLSTLLQSPLCKTWEDQCWAYFKSKTDWTMYSTLHEVRQLKARESLLYPDLVPPESQNLEEEHLKAGQTFKEDIPEDKKVAKMFTNLQSKDTRYPLERRLQSSMVGPDRLSILQALSHRPSIGITPRLRLWAHLALCVRYAQRHEYWPRSRSEEEKEVCAVVRDYMKHLMEDPRHIHLVPLYAAALPPDQLRKDFTKFMRGVYHPDLRHACLQESLKYMTHYQVGIIVHSILDYFRELKDVPENVGRMSLFEEGVVTGALSALQIEALDWCQAPQLQAQRIVEVTSMFRVLFLRYAAEGLTYADDVRALYDYIQRHGGCHVPAKDNNQTLPVNDTMLQSYVQEWQWWEALCEGHEAYQKWKGAHVHFDGIVNEMKQLRRRQNTRQDDMGVTVRKLDSVVRQMEERSVVLVAAKDTADKALRAILEDDDGWMDLSSYQLLDLSPPRGDPKSDVWQVVYRDQEQRLRTLKGIRASIIPEVVVMLHEVLYRTGMDIQQAFIGQDLLMGKRRHPTHEEMDARHSAVLCYRASLQLADLVASPRYHLHEVFPGGRDDPFTPHDDSTTPVMDPILPRESITTLDQFLSSCNWSAEALVRMTSSPVDGEEGREPGRWKLATVVSAPADRF